VVSDLWSVEEIRLTFTFEISCLRLLRYNRNHWRKENMSTLTIDQHLQIELGDNLERKAAENYKP
jgi:hypothetical protein